MDKTHIQKRSILKEQWTFSKNPKNNTINTIDILKIFNNILFFHLNSSTNPRSRWVFVCIFMCVSKSVDVFVFVFVDLEIGVMIWVSLSGLRSYKANHVCGFLEYLLFNLYKYHFASMITHWSMWTKKWCLRFLDFGGYVI